MGNEAAKAIVPVALQSLPVIIKAIKGDENSTASRTRTQEDRRILEALDVMQRNRDDIDRILQNQQQLTEAYMLLGQRMQEGGGNLQLQNGNENRQVTNGTDSRGRIRIEMDLPEGDEERREALQRFWETLANQAAAFSSENGRQLAASKGSENGCGQEERSAIAASAPPKGIDEAPQELSKLDSFLYCEICTQRYNTSDRRPTLLPACGHTFCKECLRKANRRNPKCPNCRQYTNIDVDQHPTNFAILDFLEGDEDMKPKKKEDRMDFETPDLTFEEQLEIARQLSLDDSRGEQNSQEQRNRQEEEDRRVAWQLQQEEERLMAFRYHEDKSLKARNLNDSDEFMANHGHSNGSATTEHYPTLHEERNSDGNVSDDDDDLYDDCHAVLRPSNRATYSDASRMLGEEDDRKKFHDSEDGSHVGFSPGNGYSDARRLLGDGDDVKNISDSDDECLKSSKGQEENDKTLLGEEMCEGNSRQNGSSSDSRSLYQEEMDLMLQRAEETHKQNKERRRKNKWLREQEELELAMAISRSLCETQVAAAAE